MKKPRGNQGFSRTSRFLEPSAGLSQREHGGVALPIRHQAGEVEGRAEGTLVEYRRSPARELLFGQLFGVSDCLFGPREVERQQFVVAGRMGCHKSSSF